MPTSLPARIDQTGGAASWRRESPSMPQRIFALVLAFSLAALLPASAAAHSWCPKRCCAGDDCHRADSVRRLDDGTLELL